VHRPKPSARFCGPISRNGLKWLELQDSNNSKPEPPWQTLANRGYHTLAIDGPGQGEALRLRNIPSRYDYEVPGTAAFDYVASRADVDAKRVGVMAFSLGGYYTPRMAAFEKRYAAAVA
jgi:dipeptidyl aminopeptidase/acylaminoacyl peptidase